MLAVEAGAVRPEGRPDVQLTVRSGLRRDLKGELHVGAALWSAYAGPMQLLSRHTGMWAGTNRFRLRPDDEPAEGEATAQVALGAGGHVAVLAYTWTHLGDGSQDGVLMVSGEEESDAVLALWGDSWHQKPAAAQLRGTQGDDSLSVGYSYAEGWEWRITLLVDDPTVLRWRMDNTVPATHAGTEDDMTYWAMEGELRRPG